MGDVGVSERSPITTNTQSTPEGQMPPISQHSTAIRGGSEFCGLVDRRQWFPRECSTKKIGTIQPDGFPSQPGEAWSTQLRGVVGSIAGRMVCSIHRADDTVGLISTIHSGCFLRVVQQYGQQGSGRRLLIGRGNSLWVGVKIWQVDLPLHFCNRPLSFINWAE
jgi:hypothetical protein